MHSKRVIGEWVGALLLSFSINKVSAPSINNYSKDDRGIKYHVCVRVRKRFPEILTSLVGGGIGLPAFIVLAFGAIMLLEGKGLPPAMLANEGVDCS